MKKVLTKDIFKEIKTSFGRFMSLVLITGLGVGFFVGVKSVKPSMENTARQYFEASNYMDVSVTSPFLGFSDEDISAIDSTEKVGNSRFGYMADVLTERDGTSIVVRFLSKPGAQDGEVINDITIVEGRLPEKPGECIMDSVHAFGLEYLKVGDEFSVSSGSDDMEVSDMLVQDKYKIVGAYTSPTHISIINESSSIGNGQVEVMVMIDEDGFALENPNVCHLRTTAAAAGVDMLSAAYESEYNALSEDMRQLSKERFEINEREFFDEHQGEIDDAKSEYDEGYAEYVSEKAKAEEEIADAKKELADGKKEYEAGLKSYNTEIPNAKRQLDLAKEELKNKKGELEAGVEALNTAKGQLLAGRAELEAKLKEAEDALKPVKAGIETLSGMIAQEKAHAAELQVNIETAKAELSALISLGAAQSEIDSKTDEITNLSTELYISNETAKQLGAKLAGYQLTLFEAEAKIEEERIAAQKEIDALQNELDQNEAKLNAAAKELGAADAELVRAERELEARRIKAKVELDEAQVKLAEGEEELKNAEREFEEEIAKAEAELADAKEEIAEAEEKLNDIVLSAWMVEDRDGFKGYSDYMDNSQRVDTMASVFSLFYMLVAALVSLSTMARMVEEQRGNMGVLKALGYTAVDISMKFTVYASVAALVGGIAGAAIGLVFIPTAVMSAYSMLYTMPGGSIICDYTLIAVSVIVAMALVVCVSLVTCMGELKAVPAAIMRPKAPKPGKRVFLERIGVIWKRLNFTSKVTCRNLFRYKARMLMTIVGILGCTALLLSAFGLKDAIRHLVPAQFEEITSYDAIAMFNEGGSIRQKQKVDSDIVNSSAIEDNMLLGLYSGKASMDGSPMYDIKMYMPADVLGVERFMLLRELGTKEVIGLPSDGVVITDKLSQLTGAKKGDVMDVVIDDIGYEAEVSAVVENYILHSIYISPEYYEKMMGKAAEYNAEFLAIPEGVSEDDAAHELLGNEEILGITFLSDSVVNFNDQMKSLDLVVAVLMISAALLAFVVMYNLVNINVSERVREIATIKVLGFYDKESAAYVYRENIILTILGILLGLAAGILMFNYILECIEMDFVIFPRYIAWDSFVLAGATTLFFAFVVNFIMYFRIKNINMVESLKSTE